MRCQLLLCVLLLIAEIALPAAAAVPRPAVWTTDGAEQAEAIAALKDEGFKPHIDKDGKAVALSLTLLFTRRGGYDQDMVHVARLTDLVFLELNRCDVSDVGLKRITGLKRLHTLILSPGISDDGLRYLSAFPELERLGFNHDSRVSDRGMVHLIRLPKLRYLSLNGRIGDDGTRELGKIKRLRVIDFHTGAPLGAKGIAHLEGLQDLEELGLNSFKLNDASLRSLSKLKSLHSLKLKYETQAGLNDRHVEGLGKLTQLKLLDLYSGVPTLTPNGMARLTELLPGTKIIFNQQTFKWGRRVTWG